MVEGKQVVHASRDGEIAVVTLDSPPVNALSHALRSQAIDALKAAEADPAVKAIVMIGAGRGFSGGADITEFGKPPQWRLSLARPHRTGDRERRRSRSWPRSHGTGARRWASRRRSACHYRVAVPSAKIGLPEIKLGLLPGGGGDPAPAAPGRCRARRSAMRSRRGEMPIGAKAARSNWALIDAVVEEGKICSEGALAFAK